MNETLPISPARLPSVERVLRTDAGAVAAERFGHEATVGAIRRVIAGLRESIGFTGAHIPKREAIAAEALELLEREHAPSVRRVFNLTGTVLHTNLGRAILPEAAIEAAIMAMREAVALEFDVEGGRRGERDDHVRGLICELSGAEDAVVVNNNAGAVLLVLNSFALNREAIVSRGELVEIGGSFRLPDIMARAGARLVEVGTTNRTHLRDYEQAITGETGLILKAHTSNYLIQGFTKAVPATELAALARGHEIPFVNDLGSGALVDLGRYGLRPEPTVREALSEGADAVTFSGDKLLGGPQAGIIAGRRDLVERVRRNPMKRALRIDKIRLAALEAVLKLYRDPARLHETLPTLRYFVRSRKDIRAAAARLIGSISAAVAPDYEARISDCSSQIGSGALPLETLPSAAIALTPADRKNAGTRLERLAAAFRALPIPVIGHIKKGALALDLRCLDDEAAFLAQLDELKISLTKGGSVDAG